ncbi:MAG: hypothetical protein RTU30_08670 [Candidatus Thorarchaeota archaeon]
MTNPRYPRNPSRILTTAFKMGMAITLALARDRITDQTRPLYYGLGNRIKGMVGIWDEYKRRFKQTVDDRCPDASVLLKAEHNIRRNFSRILLKTSVRYGNTEKRRVKREEGNKKYLNILWDYSGSRLRDVVKARYFFPQPVLIEVIKGKAKYGYHGSSKTPFYPVSHNHLPELDFGDMIRSPLMELCRQCLKYGVPIKAAKKYIDMLLHRLIPFLDYVYTERRSGRPNYVRGGLQELRAVVELIKMEYGTRNGTRPSITSEIQEAVSYDPHSEDDHAPDTDEAESQNVESGEKPKTHFLRDVITQAASEDIVLTTGDLPNVDFLTAQDSEELLRLAKEERRRIGTRIHRFVSRNFQSPLSLNGVIHHGTGMAYDDSGLVLLSEVPIDRGRGRVDLVLARVRQLTRVDGAHAPIICEPFMLIELKTKSAFDFDIYGVPSKSKDKNNIVCEFILERKPLTDEEWETVLANTPDKYEKGQLNAYETTTLADYEQVMKRDNDRQEKLAKAVLVVDSHQDWRNIQQVILPLVQQAYDGCVEGTLSEGDYLIPSDGKVRPRIAMRMLSVVKPNTDELSLKPPVSLQPFNKRADDDKEFILYLTVTGRGSQAQSAAAIAERWHGLEYLHKIAQRRHRDVHWFDLAGEYTDPVLREKQFRLSYHKKGVRQFFRQRVQVEDLSDRVRDFIYDGSPLNIFRSYIFNIVKGSRRPIIVVSGWETLRRSTPDSHSKYLDELATMLIQYIPDRSTILWFARPVPLAQNNKIYGTRCVAPFYQGTLWQSFVDTIIWNIPAPPDRSEARAPTNDHERVRIIECKNKDLDVKRIEVEPLRGWGEGFRPGGRKERFVYHLGSGFQPQQSGVYVDRQIEVAMKLIPHLVSKNEYGSRPKSDFSLKIEQVTAGYDSPRGEQPMMSFNPTQIYAQYDENHEEMESREEEVDGRFRPLFVMGAINRQREYRPMELDVLPPRRTTRPPTEYYLSAIEVEDIELALTELRHLRDVITFLRRDDRCHINELLERISEVILDVSDSETVFSLMSRLRLVRQTLESHVLSREIWERLLPLRSLTPRQLSKTQKDHVIAIQKRHPDILLVTGNHLFLLILTALSPDTSETYQDTLHILWGYVQPWHLMTLELRPSYPKHHTTGRSVLDRHRLLERLKQRVIDHNRSLDLHTSLTNVRFGQIIAVSSPELTGLPALWLFFQRTPGVSQMNAALLNPRGIGYTMDLQELVHEMVSDRTYWSESDLSLLSGHARLRGNESRVPVMIAEQHGVRALWTFDEEYERWSPVGRLHYTTRRFEDVTLLRTITLSADSQLKPVACDDVRQPIHKTEDLIDIALLILHKALEGCIHATCTVSLDMEERLYKVSFNERDTDQPIGELLINRTADLLEILRRPDIDCEPVHVKGQRLIWNRFRDITYDDIGLIRPWVNREDPFPGMALKLPSTADELLDATKDFDFTLELYHDPWTCPLRHISQEMIQKAERHAKGVKPQYMHRYVRSYAEPEHVSDEPGVHHGSCWRIDIKTPHTLTPQLKELVETRFTDTLVRSLLSFQEMVFQSQEEKDKFMTHTFKLELRKKCIKEAQESWHVRELLQEVTGKKYDPEIPGVYLVSPDRWTPMFSIEPERVVMQLKDRLLDEDIEVVIEEAHVALKPSDEVRELLEREMMKALEIRGVIADRRLISAIQGEIEIRMEIAGVEQEGASVEVMGVMIARDEVGGRVLFVELFTGDETHRIPMTQHLHSIGGKMDLEEFEDYVKGELNDFNLSDDDIEYIMMECTEIMKNEGFLGERD